MDKEIVDRDGLKCGKVDDLLFELREGERPVVRAIVTQHGALAPLLGSRISRVVAWLRALILGPGNDTEPMMIGWEHVTHIDVTVHVDLDRRDAGFLESEDAIWDRWIRHIPFAER